MSSHRINPSDLLQGKPGDRLGLYRKDYILTAECRGCRHYLDLHMPLLLKAFGPDATIGQLAKRLRCVRCKRRGAQIKASYIGRVNDWR